MVREKVKQKFCEGFALDRIAKFIRRNEDSSVRDRQLKTKDILYMLRHDLPELIGYYHEDDHISVDMSVNIFTKLGENNPIFYYHPRTAESDTFAQGMQKTMQRRLLDEFGSNVMCIDTTHKTCCYDGYLLGTVLILNSVGTGQPVAFFLTRGESEMEMTPILVSLKKRHPRLRPKIFMSDMAKAFCNSWKAVFSIDGVTRLFCLWHVWRGWGAHIVKVADGERQRQLREMLKNLTDAATQQDFYCRYEAYKKVMSSKVYAITNKKKNTRSFSDYFNKEYVVNGRCQLWARFGRLGSDITTNMHLESFHHTLKQRYLKRMCNRCVDYVMHVLITKVAPDFANQLDRVITMRGTSSTFQQRVKRDHGSAKYLLDQADKIKEVEIGRQWTVQSEAAEKRQYEVEVKDNYESDHNCLIRCQFCQVCSHCYVCGCPHFQFRCAPMPCKHIHGVHVLFSASSRDVELNEDDDIGSSFEPPLIDFDSAIGNDPTNASKPVNSSQATNFGNSTNPDDGAHGKAAQCAKLIDQLQGKKATIVQQMQNDYYFRMDDHGSKLSEIKNILRQQQATLDLLKKRKAKSQSPREQLERDFLDVQFQLNKSWRDQLQQALEADEEEEIKECVAVADTASEGRPKRPFRKGGVSAKRGAGSAPFFASANSHLQQHQQQQSPFFAFAPTAYSSPAPTGPFTVQLNGPYIVVPTQECRQAPQCYKCHAYGHLQADCRATAGVSSTMTV
uniref:CCHC-type domain-containing protein n=1 Tax=Plectus sambesii TaxID=2011161 RepID=A0A914XEU9_9BILA